MRWTSCSDWVLARVNSSVVDAETSGWMARGGGVDDVWAARIEHMVLRDLGRLGVEEPW